MPLAIVAIAAEANRCVICGSHLVADEWNDIVCPGCDEEAELPEEDEE